ncbi:NAF1-domain-containing protein [Lentinula raphanica]|nr:NAF1-domain-containing protein [Lentinula raphanica]
MNSFKVPLGIAQDLLLIQSLVGPTGTPTAQAKQNLSAEDDINSSGSEPDSEDEIEAELVGKSTSDHELAEDAPQGDPRAISASDSSSGLDSDSSSDSSDEEIQLEEDKAPLRKAEEEEEEGMMDEEDPGPSAVTASYYKTKNEVADVDITVPDIEAVGAEEQLELVGRIMNIIDNVVIIEGLQTELARGASDRALDADTLLVFEDRKVLGYIFETFGPTTQPMYQVKFNSTRYPMDLEKVRLSRQVYHVPQRSNFVFMGQVQAMKGSDASNMNDEEPAEHELEFSDDEAEAEHKWNLKQKRLSKRASSVSSVSSRQSTPSPSQMRDADMVTEDYFMNNNAYDEIGPYDLDYDTPISRPAPIPYDDPYADEFEVSSASSSRISSTSRTPSTSTSIDASALRPQRRSTNRETNRGGDSHRNRGRGRSNNNSNRGGSNRRGGRGGGNFNNGSNSHYEQAWHHGSNSSFIGGNGGMTGTMNSQPSFHQQNPVSPMIQWSFQSQNQGMTEYGNPYNLQQQYIQPHINPLFARQFGMGGTGSGMEMGRGSYGSLPLTNLSSQNAHPSGYPNSDPDSGAWAEIDPARNTTGTYPNT